MIKDSLFDTAIKGGLDKRKVTSFPCLRCGTCCSKYQALLNCAEVHQIAKGLNITSDKFIDKYTDHRWGGTESFLLRHENGACIFLAREGNNNCLTYCRINNFKPFDCSAWSPDPTKAECQQGQRNQASVDFRQDL
jgi:Fe-S-cluster containining protein